MLSQYSFLKIPPCRWIALGEEILLNFLIPVMLKEL